MFSQEVYNVYHWTLFITINSFHASFFRKLARNWNDDERWNTSLVLQRLKLLWNDTVWLFGYIFQEKKDCVRYEPFANFFIICCVSVLSTISFIVMLFMNMKCHLSMIRFFSWSFDLNEWKVLRKRWYFISNYFKIYHNFHSWLVLFFQIFHFFFQYYQKTGQK